MDHRSGRGRGRGPRRAAAAPGAAGVWSDALAVPGVTRPFGGFFDDGSDRERRAAVQNRDAGSPNFASGSAGGAGGGAAAPPPPTVYVEARVSRVRSGPSVTLVNDMKESNLEDLKVSVDSCLHLRIDMLTPSFAAASVGERPLRLSVKSRSGFGQ